VNKIITGKENVEDQVFSNFIAQTILSKHIIHYTVDKQMKSVGHDGLITY
jgi:hypothetical protein